MPPSLNPAEPLSQVVFVHDYVQLVFQGETFNIYNLSKLVLGHTALLQGKPGFCDALVSLIGQHAVCVAPGTEFVLSLAFEGGAHFQVFGAKASSGGPEAFQFAGKDNLLVVQQNANTHVENDAYTCHKRPR